MINNYIQSASLEAKSQISPRVSLPLDARSLVDNIDDLYNVDTWITDDNKLFIYNGMIVSVKSGDSLHRPMVYVAHDLPNIEDAIVAQDKDNHKARSGYFKYADGQGIYVDADGHEIIDPDREIIDCWTRLGFVLDDRDDDIYVIRIKQGWVKTSTGYEAEERTIEEGQSDYDNIYGLDAEGRKPGDDDYVETPSVPIGVIKIIKDFNTGSRNDIVYLPINSIYDSLNITVTNGSGTSSVLKFNGKSTSMDISGTGNIIANKTHNGIQFSLDWLPL